MSSLGLVCNGSLFRVNKRKLQRLRLFSEHPELLKQPSYEVESEVGQGVFESFVDALQGDEVEVTRENFAGLKRLCGEFGFDGLDGSFSAFDASNPGFESVESLRCEFASLSRRVSGEERGLESVKCEVLSLRSALDSCFRSLEARVVSLEGRQCEDRSEAKRSEGRVLERVESIGAESREMKSDLASLRASLEELKAQRSPAASPSPAAPKSSPAPAQAKAPQPAPKPSSAGSGAREVKFTGDAFGGIIAALTCECGGNVDEKGVVAVTDRDNEKQPKYWARNAVDLENKYSDYCSDGKPGAWLCLDFKTRRVKPTHYSIRTYDADNGCRHPKSWVLEGSLDGSGWSELDRRENNEDLNGKWFEKTFPASKSGEFRFIRLRMIGKNHAGTDWLICSAFEVFGTLLE